jgi:NAD(P)H-hydrate epimerase
MLQQAAKTELPMVIDADALNLVAAGRVLPKAHRDNWILTPHPGEAARLLDCTTAEVQADRFAAVAKLQARYGGTVILKGAGTLVASGGQVSLANVGNPGMATGGMGDVLSGVLGALLAQGMDAMTAAQLGVCLHGEAADLAVQDDGVRGLLPTDLLPYLRQLLNGVR